MVRCAAGSAAAQGSHCRASAATPTPRPHPQPAAPQDALPRRRARQRGHGRGTPRRGRDVHLRHRPGRPGRPVCRAAAGCARDVPQGRRCRGRRRSSCHGHVPTQPAAMPAHAFWAPPARPPSTPARRARRGHERGAARGAAHALHPGDAPPRRRPRVCWLRQGGWACARRLAGAAARASRCCTPRPRGHTHAAPYMRLHACWPCL